MSPTVSWAIWEFETLVFICKCLGGFGFSWFRILGSFHPPKKSQSRTNKANSNKANVSYETSLLREVVLAQCKRMEDMKFGSIVDLVSPTPCDQRLQQAIQGFLNADVVLEITLAKEAVLNCALHVHAGDVVLQQVGGQEQVGEVYFHCKVMDRFWTCLSLWRHISGNKYQMQDAPCLVATQSIQRCLVHKVAVGSADAEISP